jgi:hypothetical protein
MFSLPSWFDYGALWSMVLKIAAPLAALALLVSGAFLIVNTIRTKI